MLIVHEKMPQNLDLGFPSSIFASRAKNDDDVSKVGLVRQMTWQGDVSMYGGDVAVWMGDDMAGRDTVAG